MTTLTVRDIYKRVRTLVGDTSGLLFDETTFVNWVNDAVQEIIVENSLYQVSASTTLADDQNFGSSGISVDNADSILKIHSILVDGEKIELMSMAEFEAKWQNKETWNERGKPCRGYIWAGQIYLHPNPDAEYPIKFNYISRPQLIVEPDLDDESDVSLPIPSAYHLRVVTYCLAQVAFMDDDMQKYQQLMADFQAGVLRIRTKDMMDEEEDTYPMIRDTSDYY